MNTELNPRPISFTSDMVMAIMKGRKTQTRRVIDPQPNVVRWNPIVLNGHAGYTDGHGRAIPVKYGPAGRELWVQEGCKIGLMEPDRYAIGHYLADSKPFRVRLSEDEFGKWCKRKHPYRATPGRFMYKSLSRIRLVVVREWIERIQDISGKDILAEGVHVKGTTQYTEKGISEMRILWDKINAARGYDWDSNPWVRCVEFKVLEVKS